MKLGHKLNSIPLITGLIALAAVLSNAWLAGQAARSSLVLMDNGLGSARSAAELQSQLGSLHTGVYRTLTMVSSMDEAAVKTYRTTLAKQIDGLGEKIIQAASLDTDAAVHSQRITGQLATYKKQADTAIDLSTVDPNTGLAALQNADATFSAIANEIKTFSQQIEDAQRQAALQNAERTQDTGKWLALITGGFVLLAIVFSLRMQRRLVADLAQAKQLAEEVAEGNLAARSLTLRKDEVGQLMGTLVLMQQRLAAVVNGVRDSADGIQTASTEVAQGNADLSQRTELTASSLQETASSLEQLTGNVRQSADAAAQANQLASSAAQVAQRGGEVVSQVVATMEQINASSKKIADIIGTIDGIAFQTNILALNAAVEAARAGEQGRGFAVVAGEVRSLAQRSAEAAKEIKSLIGTSVDKVETGSKLVGDAGATMNEIVASVQRVTDIIGEITAASSEQSQGIGQVNGAVSQLDQMTQQNAALVEQSAAAADSLKEQARRLADVVAVFRLEHAALAASPVAKPAPTAAPKAATVKPALKPAAKPATKSATKPTAKPAHQTEAAKAISRAKETASGSAPAPLPVAAAKSADEGDWETF